MKAYDIKPGDVITHCPADPSCEGWTAVGTSGRVVVFNDQPVGDDVALLSLERERAVVMGYEPGSTTRGIVSRATETRTAWLRADDEIEARRDR